jgi:Ca2+-binding RTX toxin-like protein
LRGGGQNDTAYGGNGDDTVSGGDGGDRLDAGAGNDWIYGGTGNDTCRGGDGNDVIYGDAGADLMFGGPGADTFWFDDGDSGVGAANRDRISGFLRNHGDKLDLDPIDANLNLAGDQDFVFRGTAAFTGIGQIRVVGSGADRIIQGNNDSDLQADFEITLVGFNTGVLASDFSHL